MGQFERQTVGHVVLQHVQNKTLFNGLPHERAWARCRELTCPRGVWPRAKQLQRLVLGLGGEGNKGDATVFGQVRHLRGQNVFAADLAATVAIWLLIS